MAKPLIVANWKMNPPSWKEAKKLFEATKKAAAKNKNVSLVVAPPSLYLRELAKGARGGVAFAAQSAHGEASGAYTGRISLAQVKDAGAAYALVGHSEMRAAGETNEDTKKQVAAALAAKLIPILCVGEKERTHSGAHFSVVSEELRAAFAEIPSSRVSHVIIAYEPIWAIGGETTMSPRDMHEMAIFIRKTLVELCGPSAQKVKILYGAAVTEESAVAMLKDGDVNGLLVGHVSIDVDRFSLLLKSLVAHA